MKKHEISASRLLSVLVMLVLFTLSATIVSAHETTVTNSDPADGAVVGTSPAQVTAQFSEELDTQGSTMIVVDASGAQVSDGEGKVDLDDPDHATMIATLSVPLADGVYTVQWHALLTDGDASDGSFSFTVKMAGSAAQTEPTLTPTDEPTASPVPVVTQVTPPTAAPAAAPLQADPPGQLPTTGRSENSAASWMVAVAGALAVLGVVVVLRYRKRTDRA